MQGKITRDKGSEIVVNNGDTVVVLCTNDKTDKVECAVEGTLWDIASILASYLANTPDIRGAVMLQLTMASMDSEAAAEKEGEKHVH